MAIPVKAQPAAYYGMISTVEEIEGKFGPQIRVSQRPSNPLALHEKLFFFSVNSSGNSKWMQFVKSFNVARRALIQGAADISNATEMEGVYVNIQEIERGLVTIRDKVTGVEESRERVDPVVAEVFADEASCLAAWTDKHGPPPEEPIPDSPVKAAEPVPAPAPAKPAPPDNMVGVLQGKFAAAAAKMPNVPPDTVFEVFWGEVGSWGFDKDAVKKVVIS